MTYDEIYKKALADFQASAIKTPRNYADGMRKSLFILLGGSDRTELLGSPADFGSPEEIAEALTTAHENLIKLGLVLGVDMFVPVATVEKKDETNGKGLGWPKEEVSTEKQSGDAPLVEEQGKGAPVVEDNKGNGTGVDSKKEEVAPAESASGINVAAAATATGATKDEGRNPNPPAGAADTKKDPVENENGKPATDGKACPEGPKDAILAFYRAQFAESESSAALNTMWNKEVVPNGKLDGKDRAALFPDKQAAEKKLKAAGK
jgi:hypothetical protein